jgi:penicillin-binding protein 1C
MFRPRLPRFLRPHRGRKRRAALVSIVVLLLTWFLIPFAFPLPEKLLAGPAPSPLLLDRSGAVLDDFPRLDYFRHKPATLDEIPSDLVMATLAAEDKRFYEHGGVDYRATARAIKQSIEYDRYVSGASTITQQLIKINSTPAERNFRAKFREIFTARHLEARWNKDRILTAYLNTLDYGHHRQGSTEAAAHFLGKPLADLSLAECALLAGLPQAPSRLNPFRNPEDAVQRRDWILTRLRDVFDYDPERIDAALKEPLQLRAESSTTPVPHLAAEVRSRRHAHPGATTIATTVDGSLQREVNGIVRTELDKLEEKNVQHAAVVVIHNPSGEILTIVGSGDYHDPTGGQVNGALAPRSAGSSLKPFTYLLAIERHGYFPGTIIADIPTPFRTPEGLDAPLNFDRRHYGPVTMRHALANSLNVSAMRTLNAIGGPKPLHDLLKNLGLTTLHRSAPEYGLGLTIGNAEVTLVELTNAYATLARLGELRPTVLFQDTAATDPVQVFSPQSTFLIADVLSDNMARSAAFGHRSTLRLPFRCAVKTGTSTDFRDNWCIGYTAEFTVGVWVGNFDNSPMRGISGVTGAGPIFRKTMLALHRDHPPAWSDQPGGLVRMIIDTRTGHRFATPPAHGTPHTAHELCPADRLPLPVNSADYDADGKAILARDYDAWFASADNLRRDHFTLGSETARASFTLRIISPAVGSTYLLDPELPSQGTRLELISNAPTPPRWSSPTLVIDGNTAILTPGTHSVTATDPDSGQSISRRFTVESL